VTGNAGTYAGDKLEIFRYSDYITKNRIKILSVPVDVDGNFTFEIESDQIFELLIDLDVFLGKLFIEPGKTLKIVLPKKTQRSEADILNPYFEQIEFYIRELEDESNITNAVRKFNSLWNDSFDVIFKNPKHINSGVVEKEIEKINDSLSFIKNEFFEEYKYYKLLHLRQLSYYKNKDAVIKKNYSNKKVLFNNPAYNLLLAKEFETYMFEENKDTLYKVLNYTKDWKSLNNFVAQDNKYFEKDFREYFLSINLYKLFYKNTHYQNKIIRILQTADNSDINENTRIIINNILKISGTLVVGSQVINFTLYDQNKERKSLSDFRGEYIYLSFFKKDSYVCQKDQVLLDAIYKKKHEKLKIITVFIDDDHQNVIDLAKDNKFEWTLLHCYDNDRILKDYKVVAFPTYYLIDPNGNLKMIPAPGPSEGFETAYFSVYQEYKREQIRNND